MCQKATYNAFLVLSVFAIFFTSSCSPTRRITEGNYLLAKTKIKIDSAGVDLKELRTYDKQPANKTILGFKFHLFLYNLAKPGKEKFPHAWYRKIGEEPVIYKKELQVGTAEQFSKFLESRGYYQSQVTDTAILNEKKKKAVTQYHIDLGQPLRINRIRYEFEDETVKSFILNDTTNSLLSVNMLFDKEVLKLERERLEKLLKTKGFFKFSKEYIFFEANKDPNGFDVDLIVRVKQSITSAMDPVSKIRKHRQYTIGKVFIVPDVSGLETVELLLDTLKVEENSYMIYSEKPKIKPSPVLSANRCLPGTLYDINEVASSYSKFSNLGVFRIINFSFTEPVPGAVDSTGKNILDCKIELSPRKIQSYQFEIVGTNSAGDMGIRGNLTYNNYNLFKGAEHLKVVFTGALENMKNRYKQNDFMSELGIEAGVDLPKFLFPFMSAKKFVRKYSPKTTILASWNYQDRPEYIRTIVNTSYGYKWKGNSFISHQFFPIDFYYVKLPEGVQKDSVFWPSIEGTPLENSFIDHTILGMRYQFNYTNQVAEKRQNFIYFRANGESAGFLLNTFINSSPFAVPDSSSTFLDAPFFQYLKGDVDFRYYNLITSSNKIVYRFFAGVGLPYGNSQAMPFEKMYFSGGPYGIRAWSTRDLGPGSYKGNDTLSGYANNLGDIKLEGNIEYRFKLFWKLEGALFLDAGNIWLLQKREADFQRPEEEGDPFFRWNTFYNDIAVGTGLGLRFDFSFFLIRVDFGYKLRDPAIASGSKWIDRNHEVSYSFKDRRTILFGIGYPF